MDVWTAGTLEAMVQRSRDDAKIARYLGISIEAVEKARARLPKFRQPVPAAVAKPPRPLEPDCWAAECRRGSRRLAEALARYRG